MPGDRRDQQTTDQLPRIDRWLMDGFEKYFLPKFIRKHFHAVAVNRRSLPEELYRADGSMIVYANHASWWDPMLALMMRRQLFQKYRLYAPIDAAALSRYKIFTRMGFYGIELDSPRGAASFLRTSQLILQSPGASIWLTPEGKFCDCRDLTQPLMPGLAHLVHRVGQTSATENRGALVADVSRCVWVVPAAMEYTFWEERLPECLCWFGEPLCIEWGQSVRDKADWSVRLTSSLRSAQQQLAQASMARDCSAFELIMSGSGGSWSLYDAARKFAARWRGQSIQLDHSQKLQK